MEADAISNEERNSRMTNMYFVEKRAIYDDLSAQESLVFNLMLQKTQIAAQAVFLSESVARLKTVH
jgi:hypothetical protein